MQSKVRIWQIKFLSCLKVLVALNSKKNLLKMTHTLMRSYKCTRARKVDRNLGGMFYGLSNLSIVTKNRTQKTKPFVTTNT